MRRRRLPVLAVLCAALLQAGAGHAEPAPLDAAALAACAGQVGALRSDSARLLARSAALEDERQRLLARQAALSAPAASAALEIEAHAQRRALNEEMRGFNARIGALRGELAELNTVWRSYDAQCAQRSYRRSDLEALPPAAQAAMRAGLADVRVPYLPDAMPDVDAAAP